MIHRFLNIFLLLVFALFLPYWVQAQKKTKAGAEQINNGSKAAELKSDSSHFFTFEKLQNISSAKAPNGETVFEEPILILFPKIYENNPRIQKNLKSSITGQSQGLLPRAILKSTGEMIGIIINGPSNLSLLGNGKMDELLAKAIIVPAPADLFRIVPLYKELNILLPKIIFGMVNQQNIDFLPGSRGPEDASSILKPEADNTVKE